MPKCNPEDIAGKRFGRLVVCECVGKRGRYHYYRCECQCGTETIVRRGNLTSGRARSCGCLQREAVAKTGVQNATHGMSHTPEHGVWAHMIDRCRNKNDPGFANYGGRGISVCSRWESFENFYADMGPRPEGRSIDRIDNDGDYEPGNCRWTDAKTQQRNTRSNRLLTHDGRTMPVSAWAEDLGINRGTLRNRIKRGWSVERALSTR